MGANPTGASIVSFNKRSFESYGRDEQQGLNAPVSKYAAFAYTAALNYLLSQSNSHMRCSDTTVVFWAADAENACNDLFTQMMNGTNDNTVADADIRDIVKGLVSGKVMDWKGIPIQPDNHFYILGLAPNSARLSVRFFVQDTFGSMLKKLL